jgi:hypothetical protein
LDENDSGCEGPNCPALAQVARKSVEAVQAWVQAGWKTDDWQKALSQARDALSQRQRDAFDALQESSGDWYSDPAKVKLEEKGIDLFSDPLALPVLVDGALYRARLGNEVLIGGSYGDYIVIFEKIEDGKAEDAATFRVPMSKGRLLDAKVE